MKIAFMLFVICCFFYIFIGKLSQDLITDVVKMAVK